MRLRTLHLALAFALLAAAAFAPSAGAALNYLSTFGSEGVAPGQFNFAQGVATDPAGYVYVADLENHRVDVFTPAGVAEGWFAAPDGPHGYFRPNDVAVNAADGSIYAADISGRRIVKFNARTSASPYAVAASWPFRGADGADNFTYGVAVAPGGDVYAVGGGGTAGNNEADERVNHYTSTGTLLGSWGSVGAGPGQFAGYMRVGVDSHGAVYVTDYVNGRVQKFTADGTFIFSFGAPGAGPGRLYGPYGVTIDSSDNVYIGQTGVNYRIAHYTIGGLYVDDFGSGGTGPGQFTQIDGVAVDANCNLFVTDTSGTRSGVERVLKFGRTTAPFCREPTAVRLIDTLEPVVSFGESALAARRAITLSVRCPGERCALDATGLLVIGGKASSAGTLKARHLSLTRNRRGKLVLKASASRIKGLRAAIKRHRRVKINLTINGVDADGNGVVRERTVRVKAGR